MKLWIDKVVAVAVCAVGMVSVSEAIIVYSDNDYSCGWENYAAATTIENSKKVGANLAHFAANGANSVEIRQLQHNGDWSTDYPQNLSNLTSWIDQTGLSASYGTAVLGSTDLSGVDMLLLTGHYDFSYNSSEVAVLKDYVEGGGLLFADDCSHADYSTFEQSFERLMQDMYGESMSVIPADHAIYSAYHNLDGNNYSYSAAGNGTEWNQKPLVMYSPIPEPASMALLGISILGFVGIRRIMA